MAITRRDIFGRSAVGLVLASVGGSLSWMSAAQAQARGATLRTLTPTEAAWVAGLGEAIAPPAREAGLVPYLDHHLSVPPAESLLALRYLDVAPPYLDFYRPALASLARLHGTVPPPSGDPRWTAILAALLGPDPTGWQGPPGGFFLFAMRLDAVDVAYGTKAGFERLGVDYLGHIDPETAW
ncbi:MULTISPECIES: hypothetical protein [Sphingomonadales]|uniref:Gluconate 2-dehydrogenase subunit 3 family protein n=1 Tax=Rhizorhabdus wittichii (strain DSM 6014 / CCUG 31198 / JCM 15750 / NBRC 105917 / EY 4224 / RW1) TaxID=392499 RepID=A0A9J9LDW6_RHIWR|nr:hypothetical protein Swit_1065 [Rhizorhabdus wittichii RW1]